MNIRRRALQALAAAALAALAGMMTPPAPAEAQQSSPASQAQPARAPAEDGRESDDAMAVIALPVRDNLYMLSGAGGNVTVQFGEDGVMLVDAGLPGAAEAIIAAVRELTDKPIRIIVSTHVHPDHIGGNADVASVSRAVVGGREEIIGAAQIFAHEQVLARMSEAEGADSIPPVALPTDTYYTEQLEFSFNGEPIQLRYQPAAHTDGDSIVYFRRSDVVSTGDVYRTDGYPVIDLDRGGTINGIIDALNNLIDLAIPKENQEGGTLVVPGHGRISDEYDVVVYRDMVTVIRDRIQAMIEKGMTLEQVQAARPTRDYDPVYGSDRGFWTTERFVEAVYRTLSPTS